jgi:hypothetical protein
MIKKMVLPLVACGLMCATSAYAIDPPGDIIGFYSDSANSTFKTPGTTVEFTIRLYGAIVVSNFLDNAYIQPQIRMEVGSDGESSTAYATLVRKSWTVPSDPFDAFNRTDLTFAYVIRPGDMANPLRIWATTSLGFQIVDMDNLIYRRYADGTSSNVTWKVNLGLYDQPLDNSLDSNKGIPFPPLDNFNMSAQKISLETLSIDDPNSPSSPSSIVARQPATLWRVKSGATNAPAGVEVIVWTPHTNVLQIVGAVPIGSVPGNALKVIIPPGSDYVNFPIKGLDTNATPTSATVYAQRPSDYAKNVTGITNFISRSVTILPGSPSISLEFSNGLSSQTLAETHDETAQLESFQIVLSESHTNDVYVDLSITQQPGTATNIVITQPSGYFVPAGQERSAKYTFSVKDGTRESARFSTPVRITPLATNKYTVVSAGTLFITNVAPTIISDFPSTGYEYTPVTFQWTSLFDVTADMAKGIVFTWDFGDGSTRITETNLTSATFGQISKTYKNIGSTARTYPVTLTITDADGGTYTLPTHTITINPPIRPPNVSVVVNRADLTYQEGDTTATYKVILSEPAQQDTWVQLTCQYPDGTSAGACLSLLTTNILIRQNFTNSSSYAMTILDGTPVTASGIDIMPTITNATAKAQYPSAYPGIVMIQNAVPTIDTTPSSQSSTTVPISAFNAIEINKPFTFHYKVTDVSADLNGMTNVMFEFPDFTTTNVVGAIGTVTHTFTSSDLGIQYVRMTATDKDGGVSSIVTVPINVVVPLPPPSVTVVSYPVFIAETDNTAKQLTVMLSQTPASAGITQPVTVYLDVTPPTNTINGAVIIPTSVVFYASDMTKQVLFTVRDGTQLSAISGFTVTPRIATNTTGSTVYTQFQPGQVLVQNVAPVFQQPTDGSTNTVATVGQPRTFTWSVLDVAADLTDMKLDWDWGDGTSTRTIGGSGTTNHTYLSASSQIAVTVTATDKDGDIARISFYVTVKDSKKVIALPIGPNPAGFYGRTGLGIGTIEAPGASPLPLPFDPINLFYTFYFGADATDAQLIAIPSPKVSGVKQSYFFAWDGPLAAFKDPRHVTMPLAPAVTLVNLPTTTAGTAGTGTGTGTTLSGNSVQVSAIFSIEFEMFDGCGDINQDGIPDNRIQTYFIDPTAAATTATALDPIWLLNLRGYNDDNDFYPVYPTGDAQGVMDFRPIANPNTAVDAVAVNAFTAFKEIRGVDGVIGRVENLGPPRGNFNDDPGTNPTLLDTDEDGYPDGWESWFYYQSYKNGRTGSRYNPLNIAQGDRIAWSEIIGAFHPKVGRDKYSDSRWIEDFDNDGLLDIEELTIGTDPTNWDTDSDLMADGWEIIREFNPCDGRDGNLIAQNNPDGDFFAISTAVRQHIQVVISSNTVISTNHYLVALDAASSPVYSTLTTAYHYGNDTAPWAVGCAVSNNVLTPANQIAGPATTNINVLIMHFQVRDEYGFDPRTAWVGVAGGGGVPAGWPYENTDRFGIWVASHAPNTRPFTAVDEYLLMKFMYELQLNGMVGPNGWIDHVTTHIANNESTRLLVQDAWTRFATHPRTPDTDATPALSDGVPDGWELYVALPPVPHGVLRPAYGAFLHSPWDPNDYANDIDVDLKPTGDEVTFQSEFWGTDSLKPYQNAALYYGGTTNANLMTGVITIQRPTGDADTYWANKLWPTDPWNKDTDGDLVSDGAERAFIYGYATAPGAGGGLNPCSIDTDLDALPDAWELQFAGTPVAADGTTTLPAVVPGQPAIAVTMTISNGQDGSVADQYKDVDLDGLVSYQEYMTQSIRGYRYDVGGVGTTNSTGQIGQPMDITFQISSLFTAVTNVWDPCRFGWPGPTDPLYWMLPAGPNGYCSTDPNNPDSDYDGMDDYYELYHGLNPLLGDGIRLDCLDDRVAYAWIVKGIPQVWYSSNWWMNTQPGTIGFSMNFVRYPWLNGMPDADPDADGLLNLEEMLVANTPLPENYNTDPSPLWMTDPSNINSITARFYSPKAMFFWPPTLLLPLFTFPFEMNEGYDTDNDGGSDKDELIANRGTKSDSRDSEDPLRRQAIWFSGTNSAAVTPYIYSDYTSASGSAFQTMVQAFRSFTVELWARPEWSSNNNVQILIERAFNYGQSDASQVVGQRLRRNFLIGIETNGCVFAGFDNPGGQDEHTDIVRLQGEKIVTNTWVHLVARMDGRTQMFTLFVNGVSQGEMPTSLIPATGIDAVRDYPTQAEIGTIVYRRGSLTLGAGSASLSTLGIGIGSSMSWLTAWANYNNFYRGWIDEVRVWDGARSTQEINDNFKKRFTREDILANRTQILAELNSGAGRSALSLNNYLSPILLNYYTFNNLFSAHEDPYVATVPRGFNSTAVNMNRPSGNETGATVGWWDRCAVKSTVYTNWNYLPWIENLVSHMPRVTLLSSTNGVTTTYVNDNVVSDSIYWTRRAAGNMETKNSFPNNNNPYGFTYNLLQEFAEFHTQQTVDLLPIGGAWAKQCVDFWDDKGASGNWLENNGTTNDGLPAWWITLHGTSGGWNDLYTGSDALYRASGMTNGEVYQRNLAKGMLPNAANTSDFNTLYAQVADSSGGGIPDWWKNIYGLGLVDKTGANGPLGDPDKDGLSNYAEYQISEVYRFRYSSPLKFKTDPAQPLSDYFMKPTGGKLTMGAMLSDHDYIEDWWEELYSPTAANPYVHDSKTDYDADGWSNWAEARYSQAIATVRPDLRELVMVNAIRTYELPIPTVDTRLNYKGVQTSGNVVIQAFSSSSMNGDPDATWNIAFGQVGAQANTVPLGFYEDKTIRARLSPGSVVPGTVHLQLTDTWTGVTATTGFDKGGVIYSMDINNVWEPLGTINYITGEMVFDMGTSRDIILDAATYPTNRDSYVEAAISYFEMTYSTQLPSGWPQHIYLGRATTGALKEGKNYFFAFIDADANGAWDAGEPAGIGTPFETDIGWDANGLNIQLTDYTPNNLRLSLTTGLRSEDVVFGTGTQQGAGQQATTASGYKRVRIIRAAVQTSNFTEGPIFDKTISGRDYIHEGDLMTMPTYAGYGLDWGFQGIQYPNAVGAITYKVYVGEQDTITNNALVAAFTNKFDGARAVPTSILPAHGAYVYTERPTFTWSLTSTYGGYNAFAFELRRGSTAGTLVYPITVRPVPLKDTATDHYIWEAPFYMGDKNVVNNGVYYWRLQMLNPRYSTNTTTASEWSSWKIFRWDVNSPLSPVGTATNLNGSSSGYGQLRAMVKYFGAASNLADRVILQAFNNRGFTGFPAGQFAYAGSQTGLITNMSLSATNAIAVRGLTPGTYYVRAFIDSNTNGVLDAWESWGYANYYGETSSLYDVRPVEVSYSAISSLVTIYIEDNDADQDWFPDAYEYELNPGSTNFLELTGPNDAWNYRGDSEINPTNTVSGGFFRVMMSMVSGSSAQKESVLNLVVGGSDTMTAAIPPAVKIQSLSFSEGGSILDFDLTAGKPAQSTSTFVKALLAAPVSLSVAAEKAYTYRVRFSPSLATPRPWETIVKEDTVTVDATGTKTIISVIDNMPAAGVGGFFYVEIIE